MSNRIVIAANSAWNIVNFRSGLVQALKAAGYEPIIVAPPDPSAKPRMAELGVEWVPIRIDRSGLSPIADLRLLFAYAGILRRFAPAAFLGFTVKPNVYGCTAARLLRTPRIANISGLGTAFIRSGPLTTLVSAMYRFALQGAEVVFFQNPDDRSLFVQKRIVRPGQARLIPGSGIDLDHFAPAPLPQGTPKFLLIARLLGDKGIREYAAAARLLRAEFPHAEFQLLGPLDEGNRTAIRRDELDGWIDDGTITYRGESDDVRPFIADASAVVLPSYREGLPRSLLEGAAMARPLIATDVPGCRELVKEGVSGLLCEARSAQSLAAAMVKLCRMPARRRVEMGLAARDAVEEKFGEHLVIQAYLDALSGLRA